ncbi:hypothetical protein ASJ81_18325 [Methanosarcina spelaei]|uniref:Uncharacterized protein n=1 Tax=Methanosarcina spelaei TaxID=1036679 RepID=A0A2A2HVE3_9EURY|nr:hypothetical protein ASJ81_18325 [Methanosarcina spelaei]
MIRLRTKKKVLDGLVRNFSEESLIEKVQLEALAKTEKLKISFLKKLSNIIRALGYSMIKALYI